MTKDTGEQDKREQREQSKDTQPKPGSSKKNKLKEEMAVAALITEEENVGSEKNDFTEKTPEERRTYLTDLINNSEFSAISGEIESIFIQALENTDISELENTHEKGLPLAEAKRCLFDTVRTEQFHKALREIIKQGDVAAEASVNSGDTVVEAGAGTGILAIMAAAFGAKKVYALEINPQTVKACQTFVEHCGFGNIIEVIEADATEYVLPEEVDVIISENMYTGMFEEPQIQVVNHLRKFLKDGGRVIPQRFRSYIELVTAPDTENQSAVRSELPKQPDFGSSKAQFDVISFEQDENLDRETVVLLKAKSDTTVNAVNVSSIVELSRNVVIDSNTCDFLGQDEVIQLEQPVDLKADELYEARIDYQAGAKPMEAKISIAPAKKLRSGEAVTNEMRAEELTEKTKIEEQLKMLGERMFHFENLEGPISTKDTVALARLFTDTTDLIHKSRMKGLFELYELASFHDQLDKIYNRLDGLPIPRDGQIDKELVEAKETIDMEAKFREIETIFYDSLEQIHRLTPSDKDIDIELIKKEAPACAKKLEKCAHVLFDFELGGVFRIDEFYNYVEKLEVYHAALNKLLIGQGIEKPEGFEELMNSLGTQLAKHAENLQGVPELLAGKTDIMNFKEYNELAMKMTEMYKIYLEKRSDDSEAVVNGEANKSNPNEAVACEIGSTKGGRRFLIEFKGKKGCEFGRCANCCFFFEGSTDHNVGASHIKNQFNSSLERADLLVAPTDEDLPKWAKEDQGDITKIDILSPGSFLNDKEMPKAARTTIFEKIAQLPFQKILIESRIEYIDEEEVDRLQSILRPDQKIEIGIGLESANNLIREISISKGYSLSEFEESVEMLAKKGIDVQVYSIIKPALLEEKTALEDSVQTGIYLAELAKKIRDENEGTDFQLTMKLEQAFIQKGGFLHFLHKDKMYQTPWSYTTGEIAERLCDDEILDNLNLQVGMSDDFPPPIDKAKNRLANGEECVESSKAINDALQAFNIDHDVDTLKKTINMVKESHPESYQAWQQELGM